MSVTVIHGRSGSGKSRFLMAHIASLIKDPFAKIIVLVPGQLTFETEKKIMSSCSVRGILGLEVLSIQRLAFRILDDTGNDVFVSEAQKAMVCRKALMILNNPYGEASLQPDFDVCAAGLISRLKSYNQTPVTLRAAAEGLTDDVLLKKVLTSADLLEQYDSIIEGRPDMSDIYTRAALRAGRAGFLKDAHIIIDGLDSYSPAVMMLLTQVMALAADTLAAFRSEGDGVDAGLFASETKDRQRFVAAAAKSGHAVEERVADLPPRYQCEELAFLETNLYRYPYASYQKTAGNIRLFEAENAEQEIDMLAANILTEVKNGRRFRDMAVVAGGLEGYAPVLKTKLANYGIPYFMDERRSLADNAFFDFLYSALCAAAGDMAAVRGYVFSDYAPLSFEQRALLKKYAGQYALKGWHFYSGFRFGESAETAEALRSRAMAPLTVLAQELGQGGAGESVASIRRFLQACAAEEKLTAFCVAIDEPDTRKEFEYFSQVFAKSMEVINGIERIFGDMSMDVKTLCGLVKTGFAATKIALIPPATDEVGVFDISVARLPDIAVLFAIGVHDGVWPAKDDGPGILSVSERAMLFDAGVDVGVYDPGAEKLKIYSALTKPKQRLYLSHNAKTGQPSILIDRIRRLFPTLAPQRQADYVPSAGMNARILDDIAGMLNGRPQMDDALGMLAAFIKQPGWRETAAQMLLRTNAALPIGQDDARMLYGGIRCSATRIETYYQCPFRHFLDHGIRAVPERDYTSDKIDIGSFMHLALDLFAQTLIADRADLRTLSEEAAAGRMRDAVKKAAVQHSGAKLIEDERFALQYALLTNELIDAARRIKAHFDGSDAAIFASEQAFDDFVVPTAFGDVTVSGKIDRIDVANGYFRIVDYKSSDKTFSLKDFSAGVALQLPIYIEAARRRLEKSGAALRPAGGYYMRIGDTYHDDSDTVAKNARMTGISLNDPGVLSGFSAVLEGGRFVAIDQSLTASGALRHTAGQRLFSPDELDGLLGRATDMIKTAAEDIYGGVTAIRPVKGTTGGEACTYCGYASVCMMDTGFEGNAYRTIEAADKNILSEGQSDEPDME